MICNIDDQQYSAKIDLFYRISGKGRPLLMLHGFPENGGCWDETVKYLEKNYTLIVPDLPGYGNSKIITNEQLPTKFFSKRHLAEIFIKFMYQLGYDKFNLVGHDRGARVGYRMALDNPASIDKLILLDVITTYDALRNLTPESAHTLHHWFFMTQDYPYPEEMIANSSDLFIQRFYDYWKGSESKISSRLIEKYKKDYKDKIRIHNACEDYRAALKYDAEDEKKDLESGNKISCETLVLWGNSYGSKPSGSKPSGSKLKLWEEWCTKVTGESMPCGHFINEEIPEVLSKKIIEFIN